MPSIIEAYVARQLSGLGRRLVGLCGHSKASPDFPQMLPGITCQRLDRNRERERERQDVHNEL